MSETRAASLHVGRLQISAVVREGTEHGEPLLLCNGIGARATLRPGGAGRSAPVGSLPNSTNAAAAGAACFGLLPTPSMMTRSAVKSQT